PPAARRRSSAAAPSARRCVRAGRWPLSGADPGGHTRPSCRHLLAGALGLGGRPPHDSDVLAVAVAVPGVAAELVDLLHAASAGEAARARAAVHAPIQSERRQSSDGGGITRVTTMASARLGRRATMNSAV